jgi:hypothetical protein
MNAIELVLYAIIAPLPLFFGLTSAIWPEKTVVNRPKIPGDSII